MGRGNWNGALRTASASASAVAVAVSAKHRQSDIGTANTKPKTKTQPTAQLASEASSPDLVLKQIKLKDNARHNFKQCNKGRVTRI